MASPIQRGPGKLKAQCPHPGEVSAHSIGETDMTSDVIPLGVSGLVTVPRSRVTPGNTGASDAVPHFLLSEDERRNWLLGRLDRQLDSPLIASGSGTVARQILQRFPVDPRTQFVEKLLLTLRDGEMHSTLAVAATDHPVAACFVSWRGAWQDMVAKRYGDYLPSFLGWIKRLNDAELPVTAFLQIDAFIEEEVDPDEPLRELDDCIALALEYSYLPGLVVGRQPTGDPLPNLILLNSTLLSSEQKSALGRLIDH